MGKTVNIAVFVAGLDEEYQNNIITGINDFARRNKVNVTYFAAYGGMLDSKIFDIGEYSMYSVANLELFDGVILMTNTINDMSVRERIISSVKEAELPAVVFDCADYPEFTISVSTTPPPCAIWSVTSYRSTAPRCSTTYRDLFPTPRLWTDSTPSAR